MAARERRGDTCFVINEQRMPSTVRPSLDLAATVERMRDQNLTNLPVTRSDGVLLGVLLRDDAERGLESR
jgi:Mg/Co/Ni transporter MgtE